LPRIGVAEPALEYLTGAQATSLAGGAPETVALQALCISVDKITQQQIN